MSAKPITRRRFLKGLAAATVGTVLSACAQRTANETTVVEEPVETVIPETVEVQTPPTVVTEEAATRPELGAVVSIAKIESSDFDAAVRRAIELLGGIEAVMAGKSSIMLKPSLSIDYALGATSPKVVRALAAPMLEAGKEVVIAEGSMGGPANTLMGRHRDRARFGRTVKPELLDEIQQSVFDATGYVDVSESMDIPLVNLHTGEMVDVGVPNGFVFEKITVNRALSDVEMVCSVPIMKTNPRAVVSLGMKNMMGAYPGSVYGTPRCTVHDLCAEVEPSGTAAAIVDIVRATKPGLVIVDAYRAQASHGGWPHGWHEPKLEIMNLIIAGTNPLAVDMVSASVMGFGPEEIPTFEWCWKAGMQPTTLDEIEVRGEEVASVRRDFARPKVFSHTEFLEEYSWCREEV